VLLLPGSPASVARSVSNPSDDDRLTGKVDFDFEDLRTKSLKNITSPIRVYRSDGKIVEKTPQALRWLTHPVRLASTIRRAIAVLPFSNLSEDPEHEFFADGITEDIIGMLSTHSGLLRSFWASRSGQALSPRRSAPVLQTMAMTITDATRVPCQPRLRA